jgi:hypothetical protein
MHAGNDALDVLIDFAEDGQTDARHDAHVDDDVRRIGELHADLRHGRIDGAHAEREHIHGAAAHGAIKERLELAAHLEGVDPVVGGAGGIARERADEGAIFHAGDVACVRAGVIAPRPEILIELDESAGGDHLGAQRVVLFLRAIDPVDIGGAGKLRHFFHPAAKVFVAA